MRLRLKAKVYEKNGKRWMVSHAIGPAKDGMLCVFLMREEETPPTFMSVDQYNALPYFWFEEQGPAPKGTPESWVIER